MAHVRKGMLVPSPQWWKHLRDWKRIFWKKHRKAEKKAIRPSVSIPKFARVCRTFGSELRNRRTLANL